MLKKIKFLSILITSLIFLLSCSNEPAELTKIKFMAGYKPQANLPFVAAYVAKEKGYFLEEGLDVEILHSTGSHLKLLSPTSQPEPGSNPGVPISSIMLFGQKGQQAFISLKDSNVKTISDWEGSIFGYKISLPPEYLAMLNTNNLDRTKIQEVKVGFDPRILTEGKVDILSVFKSNEPNLIKKLGYDLNIWDPGEYGVPSLGLTYITLDDTITKRSDILERFNIAILKSIDFILNNRDEAIEIVMLYAPKSDKEHQIFMLDKEIEQSTSPAVELNGFGWSEKEKWQSLHDFLLEYRSIDKAIDINLVYTNQFLGKSIESDKKTILDRIGLGKN